MTAFVAEMWDINYCRWIIGLQAQHLSSHQRLKAFSCLEHREWAQQADCIKIVIKCHDDPIGEDISIDHQDVTQRAGDGWDK